MRTVVVRAARALLVALVALTVTVSLAVGGGGSGEDERRGFAARTAPPPAFPQQLRTHQGRIVRRGNRPIALRGFNVITVWGEGRRLRGWAAHHFHAIRRARFNTVRLVMFWEQFEPQRGRFDRARLRALDTIVRRAQNAGLYVVLDPIHLFDGQRHIPAWARGGTALDAIERHAPRYLRMLARRFRDVDVVAAYDLVNEPPSNPPDHDRILRMYGTLIRAVREVDPDKIVMFSPAYGDAWMNQADLSLLGPNHNLVFTLHDYYSGNSPGNGYEPDGSQARNPNEGAVYAWDGRSGYPRPDAAALERHLLANVEIMRRAGIPTWIGEFGMNARAPNARRWIRDKVALFKRHGIGYAWWLYASGGGSHVLDGEERLLRFVRALR